MKKKQIVFFLSESINKRNLDRFGYYILKKIFDVKMIDVSALLNIEQSKKKINKNSKSLIKTVSWKELKYKIQKKIFFVDFATRSSFRFILFQKYLIKNGSKKIYITPNILPTNIFFNKNKKLFFLIKNLMFLKIFKKFLFFIKYRILKRLNPNPNYALIAGSSQKNFFSSNTKIIESHSLDYNRFLESKKKKIFDRNYNVFIDQMMFLHPDLKNNNLDKVNKNQLIYLNDLKKFFINLRKIDNKNIIFIFHPRSNYKYKKIIKKNIDLNFCKFREWKKTDIYIKHSSTVICHTSSAIQMAILCYKPIIFLTHQIFSDYFKKYIIGLSEEIKLKPINFELNNLNISKIKKVNKKTYDKYIYNYISINKSKSSSWDDMIKLLNTINL